jgi:hypothetical protein
MGHFTFKGIPAYAGGDWESPVHFFLCTCEQDEEPAQHFVFIPRPDEGNSAIDLGEPKKKRRRPQTRYVTYGSEHFHWDEEQVKKDYPDLPEALVCPDDAPDPDMDKMWEAFEKVCSEVYEYLMNDTPPVRTCLFGADELIDPEY